MADKAAKPNLFTLNRDKTVSSTKGHTIEFKKGVATHVPREMWAEVQAIGALPSEEIVEEEKPAGGRPGDPATAKEDIFKAFEQLVVHGERESFSANGAPHRKAIEKILGWDVDTKERDALWQEFKVADKN